MWTKKKYMRLAKGFRGRAKNCPRVMMPRVEKSLQHSYKGRKMRPRIHRQEWIAAINAGVRQHGLPYSQLIFGLNRSNLTLDRKILANLAINEPYSFKAVVDEIRTQVKVRDMFRDDMNFIEAIDKNYLVYGQVQDLPVHSDFRIPYLVVRDHLPAGEVGKVKVISKEDIGKN